MSIVPFSYRVVVSFRKRESDKQFFASFSVLPDSCFDFNVFLSEIRSSLGDVVIDDVHLTLANLEYFVKS